MIDELVCTECAARFAVGRRTSEERYHQAAIGDGWLLGWPQGRVYCPDHHPQKG